MEELEEIRILEDLLLITDSPSGKEVINNLICRKWKAYFNNELSTKNKLQIELIKDSGYPASYWINKYAEKFNDIIKSEKDLVKIKKELYRGEDERF